MDKQSALSLLLSEDGKYYQITSINSTEKIISVLMDMGLSVGTNLQVIKKHETQEIVIQLNYDQITLTPKLINAIRVVEISNLKHHTCGNCGHGCGR